MLQWSDFQIEYNNYYYSKWGFFSLFLLHKQSMFPFIIWWHSNLTSSSSQHRFSFLCRWHPSAYVCRTTLFSPRCVVHKYHYLHHWQECSLPADEQWQNRLPIVLIEGHPKNCCALIYTAPLLLSLTSLLHAETFRRANTVTSKLWTACF